MSKPIRAVRPQDNNNEDLDDPYSGFDGANPLLDVENDQNFQLALARTSHGRRPVTSKVGSGNRLTTAGGARGRTAIGTARPVTSSQSSQLRPGTAIKGAGYVSQDRAFDPLKANTVVMDTKPEDNPEDKCRQMEKKVNELLEESIFALDKRELKQALEKAKEAGRKERAAAKLREQLGLTDQMNLDLTFNVHNSEVKSLKLSP